MRGLLVVRWIVLQALAAPFLWLSDLFERVRWGRGYFWAAETAIRISPRCTLKEYIESNTDK